MLSSPRRIAVVILALATGFALERWFEVEQALLPALLVGVVVALLVPARTACAVQRPERRT